VFQGEGQAKRNIAKEIEGNTASPPTEEGLKKMMRGFCVDDVGLVGYFEANVCLKTLTTSHGLHM